MTTADIQYLDQKFSKLFEGLSAKMEGFSQQLNGFSDRLDGFTDRLDEVTDRLDKSLDIQDHILMRLTNLEDDNKAAFAWLRRHDEKLEEHDLLLKVS